MSIILKNSLSQRLVYATDTPSGSGYVESGGTKTMPAGTKQIYWTSNPDASPGGNDFGTIKAKDGFIYDVNIAVKAI